MIEAMKDHDAVLLSNHGQVVCGRDFDEVLERALFFEMAWSDYRSEPDGLHGTFPKRCGRFMGTSLEKGR